MNDFAIIGCKHEHVAVFRLRHLPNATTRLRIDGKFRVRYAHRHNGFNTTRI